MKIALPLFAAALLSACSDPQPAATANDTVVANDTAANDQGAPINFDEALPEEGPIAAPSINSAAVATAEQDRYLGRWIGVEGMYLTVTAKPGGGVTMDMQWDLDHRGTFDGSVTAEGLRFVRNGVAETAVPSDGDATGLKWLAGKTDCLTVKPGEGYCRR